MNVLVERIGKATAFIEERLSEEFSLEDVSSAAACSPFHFFRSFRAVTGFSLGAYVRARRLTVAAERLAASDDRILDIALDARFESQEAFTRAFKEFFGITPGKYRRTKGAAARSGRPPLTRNLLISYAEGGFAMTPYFKDLEEFFVIGLGRSYSMGKPHDIPKLWDEFNQRSAEIPAKPDVRCAFGVCAAVFSDGVMTDEFHYTAGLEAEADAIAPQGMEKVMIPAGRYAVFTHRGHIAQLQNTMQFIWGQWLPGSGFEQAPAPDFELYDRRFDPETGEGEVDVYVPIRKTKS